MELTIDQVRHIANLARLELSNQELAKYGDQLSAILGYIDQLRKIDVDGVEPTAQVSGLVNSLREDEVILWENSESEAALDLATEIEDHQVKVKRVLG